MFKQPKDQFDAINRYAQLKKHRSELEKQARECKIEEAMLEEWMVNTVPVDVPWNGDHGKAILESKTKYTIADINKLFDYVEKNKSGNGRDLLIVRLNEKTVRAFKEQRKTPAGVSASDTTNLSYRSF